MKTKLLLLGIVSLIAARTLTAQENWRLVRKSAEITGMWAGSITIPTPADSVPASSMGMYLVIKYDEQTEYMHMELKVDFEMFLDDLINYVESQDASAAPRGLNKPALWKILETELAAVPEISGIGDYYVILAMPDFVPGSGMNDSELYINSDRTKLKFAIEMLETLFPGGSYDAVEFILDRQPEYY
jgi:hypothetical protein